MSSKFQFVFFSEVGQKLTQDKAIDHLAIKRMRTAGNPMTYGKKKAVATLSLIDCKELNWLKKRKDYQVLSTRPKRDQWICTKVKGD